MQVCSFQQSAVISLVSMCPEDYKALYNARILIRCAVTLWASTALAKLASGANGAIRLQPPRLRVVSLHTQSNMWSRDVRPVTVSQKGFILLRRSFVPLDAVFHPLVNGTARSFLILMRTLHREAQKTGLIFFLADALVKSK